MKTPDIIAQAIKKSQENMPDGQSFNLYSDAACHMLARDIYEELLDRKLLVNIVPPINPGSNK
ncbi:hypothetical protein CL634_01285 [bacterium]|nr:hypothetical protein [bacterium]|tara:strand:+ start:922 stop:1110 length:189 start_codon:yes stop_codon:yes gene_type:complete